MKGADGVDVTVSVGVAVMVGVDVGEGVIVGVKVNVGVGVSVAKSPLSGLLGLVSQMMSKTRPAKMSKPAAP